jgi:hypothetical protein
MLPSTCKSKLNKQDILSASSLPARQARETSEGEKGISELQPDFDCSHLRSRRNEGMPVTIDDVVLLV